MTSFFNIILRDRKQISRDSFSSERVVVWLSIPGGGHRCLSGQDGFILNHKKPGRFPFAKGIARQLSLLTPPSAIYGTGQEILSVNFRTP